MRSFSRVPKAPPLLPTWLGNRVVFCKASSLAQTVEEELRQPEADACSNAICGPVQTGLISGTPYFLRARVFRPGRGVATFSTNAGGSGRVPGRRKDPALLLGAGWEGGGEDVAVAVWWDFENCNVPLGIEVYKVGVNIVSGLRSCGFKGPVSVSAYGDTLQLSRSTQEALASTGIRLHHIPSGGKDSSDRALLVDLILWTFEHPPPAHLFLISGDRDFSNALHRLRMMNYNILLACPAGTIVSPALLGAATHVWQWNSLVRGEGLLVANPPPDSRPPDGSPGGAAISRQSVPKPYSPPSFSPGLRPNGNGPVADLGGKPSPPPASPSPVLRPKAVEENSLSPSGAAKPDAASTSPSPAPPQDSKATDDREASAEAGKLSQPSSDSLLRQVPPEVLQQFRQLLVSHPDGIMLSDLQTHIFNEKLSFERDFYGHGKIVPFLSSMPDIVQLERVLMKDNRSWSYLLTASRRTAEGKQGPQVTSDNVISGKASKKQEIQKATKQSPEPSSKTSETPTAAVLASQLPLTKKVAKVNLPEVSPVSSSSTKQIQETLLPFDRQSPALQSAKDSVVEPAHSSQSSETQVNDPERSTEEVLQRGSQDERVEDRASSQGFRSFFSPLMSRLRGWQRDLAVIDSSPHFPQEVSGSSVDKSDVKSLDVAQKLKNEKNSQDVAQTKVSCPEECSKQLKDDDLEVSSNQVKGDVGDGQSNEVGIVVGEENSQERLVGGGKAFLHGSDGGSEEKVKGLSDDIASGEQPGYYGEERAQQESTIVSKQAETEDTRQSWKTWLFGPTKKELAPSPKRSPITESSTLSAVHDLSDLDQVSWKELLSLPQSSAQTSGAEFMPSSQPTIRGSKDEALMGSSSSSLTSEEQKFDQDKNSHGKVRKELKEHLYGTKGIDGILSKASDQMAAENSIRPTDPQKIHGLEPSQRSNLVKTRQTEEALKHVLPPAQGDHSAKDLSDERQLVMDGLKAMHARLTETVKRKDTQSQHEFVVPEEQAMSGVMESECSFYEEESQNASGHVRSKVMDKLSKNPLAESSSSSTDNTAISKQDGEISVIGNESAPSRAPGSVNESSLAAPDSSTTPVNETTPSLPSLTEFQGWFLKTVKESYKSSERTRRIGFDLSLVKPDFERKFCIRLDPGAYGYVKLQDLVASVSAIRLSRPRNDMCVVHLLKEGECSEEGQRAEPNINTSKVSRWPQMYHDCKSLVHELMLENPDGLPGSKLKPLFISRFQYPLDHKRQGYQRMSDLLRLMPDVVSVNGKLLVPSEELLLSLKHEAAGEENMSDQDLIVEEDVTVDTCLRSEQDVIVEKTGLESLDSWGEIDGEGNGGSMSSFEGIREVTLEGRPGQQDPLVFELSTAEELSSSMRGDSHAMLMVENERAGMAEYSERIDCSVEGEFPVVEEYQPELFNERRDDSSSRTRVPPLAGSEDLHLHGEPLVNGGQTVEPVVGEGSADEQFSAEPLLSTSETGEVRESHAGDMDKDAPEEANQLVSKDTQNVSLHVIEDAPELSSASVVSIAITKSEGEKDIKPVAGNDEGVEPKSSGSWDYLGNVVAGTGPGTALHLHDTPVDVVSVSMETINYRQSVGSENWNRTEQEDRIVNSISASSPEELVQITAGGNYVSSKESREDLEGFIADELPDTELKPSSTSDKELPIESFVPSDIVHDEFASLTSKEGKKLLEASVGDEPSDTQLKKSSSRCEESPVQPSTACPTVNGSFVSREDDSYSALNNSSPATSNASAPMHVNISEQIEISNEVYQSQPQQGEESLSSNVVPSDDKESTIAEARHEGREEGPHSESISPDRSTHKSIWKRLFS